MDEQSKHSEELFEVLNRNKKKRRRKVIRTVLTVLVILVILAVAGVSARHFGNAHLAVELLDQPNRFPRHVPESLS